MSRQSIRMRKFDTDAYEEDNKITRLHEIAMMSCEPSCSLANLQIGKNRMIVNDTIINAILVTRQCL